MNDTKTRQVYITKHNLLLSYIYSNYAAMLHKREYYDTNISKRETPLLYGIVWQHNIMYNAIHKPSFKVILLSIQFDVSFFDFLHRTT